MLTYEENKQLIKLLEKLSWPVPSDVFDAICGSTSMNPIELAVLREGKDGLEVFMTYRNDKFFTGWHITGSIILPGRTIDSGIDDIIVREVGISIKKPHFEFVRFRQFMKGDGQGQCKRGQIVSLIHILFLPKGIEVPLDEMRRFFPLKDLPEDIIPEHVAVLSDIKEYLYHL